MSSAAHDEPTEHEVFEILANPRRRYVLRILSESGTSTPLGTLAERVAARENDTTVDRVSTDERKRVYTALQQSHLPKMERAGAVRFDPETTDVVPTPHLDAFDGYLDDDARAWYRYYLGLAIVSGGLVLACASQIGPFASATVGLFALSVAGLGAIAIAHAYASRGTGSTRIPDDPDR